MYVRWECFEDGGLSLAHWMNEPNGMDGIVHFIRQVMGYYNKPLTSTRVNSSPEVDGISASIKSTDAL